MNPHPFSISVVLPCLNEADSLGYCLDLIQTTLSTHQIAGEIIVADNGSTDESIAIAQSKGARVISVTTRGYGVALQEGVHAATHDWIIMGDADGSYDFSEIPRFIEQFQKGNVLVMGCRLPAGGGTILEGAMPWTHQWIGNPFFSAFMRTFHKTTIHDVYCGLRGFQKSKFLEWNPQRTGMEFAVEMVLRASQRSDSICEIPITLKPDRRVRIKSHLHTFQDGWKTLKFLLIFAPHLVLLAPGLLLILSGLLIYGIVYLYPQIGTIHFDAHTLAFGSFFLLLGYQLSWGWIFAQEFLGNPNSSSTPSPHQTLKKMLRSSLACLIGILPIIIGFLLMLFAFLQWQETGFQSMSYSITMKKVLPGIFFSLLGAQTLLGIFLLNLFQERRF